MQQSARRQRKTMPVSFISLISMWLLLLAASGQSSDFTTVVTREATQDGFTQAVLMTTEASQELSEVRGQYSTLAIGADGEPMEPAAKPPLQTIQTLPSQTSQEPTTPTNNIIMSQLNSSTVSGIKSATDLQSEATSAADLSTESSGQTTTRMSPTLSISTQSHHAGMTSTLWMTSEVSHPSASPTPSTNFISTATTSTKPADKSASTSLVISGDTTLSKGLSKTSRATTKIPPTFTTAKKKEDSAGNNSKSSNETNPGKAVAGIIGGALLLMMVGFLVIFIKKRRIQKQQVSTSDWAGPSPFLEDGPQNGHVALRSANRISLSSFLPQRLSKRLSLLPETDEELQDMAPGATFGDKHQGTTFGQHVDGKDTQESSGTAQVVLDVKSTEDAPETGENSAPAELNASPPPPETTATEKEDK